MWILFQLTSHIRCPDLLLVNDIVGGGSNVVRDGVKADNHTVRVIRRKETDKSLPKVSEHHSCTKNHGSGVGAVGSHNIRCYMTTARFKKCIFLLKHVRHRRQTDKGIKLTRPTLQPGTIPGPPTKAAPILETIAPYKFGITMTSNCPGRATSCIELVKKSWLSSK